MTDQNTPEVDESDELPPVHINLRNTGGDADTVELRTPYLGLAPYVLITIGDEGFEVEGSHMTLDDFAGLMGIVATAALLAEDTDPTLRASVIELLQEAEVADRG